VKVARQDRRIGEPPVQLADPVLAFAPRLIHLHAGLLAQLDVDADLTRHALDERRHFLVAVVGAEDP
jgi:hypothetical protein